jgi:WD40 repeat protein
MSSKYIVPVAYYGLAIFRFEEGMSFDYETNFVQNYDSVDNDHGLGVLGSRFLAFPGISQGNVQVVNLETMKSIVINAHTSGLRALALSASEDLIATASTKGTIIRVFSTASGAKVCQFRRGLEQADVFSLAFSKNDEFLALTSDRSSLHIFELARSETPTSPHSEVQSRPQHQRRVSDTNASRSNPIRIKSRSLSKGQGTIPSPRGSPNLGSSPNQLGSPKRTSTHTGISPNLVSSSSQGDLEYLS